jgi:hypothetical protein
MNRGELKLRVSRVLGIGLGTDDAGQDEEELLNELANEAVVDILSRTRVHVRETSIPITSVCDEFDIGDTILRIWRLRRYGSNDTDPTSLTEGTSYDLESDEYAFPGFTRIVLGRQAAVGDSITAWYTPMPAPMSDDAHDPATKPYGRIPAVFHRAIIDYMCWHAADKLGDMQAGRGERYRILYEGKDGMGSGGSDLGRIKFMVNQRGGLSRVKRDRALLAGDRDPSFWTG